MEVVDKNGITIQTGFATVGHEKFLKEIIPSFDRVMVGVGGGKEPFAYIYFEVSRQDVIDTVRMNQCKVTFSIMFNSRVSEKLLDILYIKKLKQNVA
jgi:hypothetical protein